MLPSSSVKLENQLAVSSFYPISKVAFVDMSTWNYTPPSTNYTPVRRPRMVTGFVSVLDGSGSYHLHCEMNDDIRKRTQVICRHLQMKMGVSKVVSRMYWLGLGIYIYDFKKIFQVLSTWKTLKYLQIRFVIVNVTRKLNIRNQCSQMFRISFASTNPAMRLDC